MKNSKLSKAIEIFNILDTKGLFLSNDDKQNVLYLYSSFSSTNELINIILLNKGNSISQQQIERFCFTLMVTTKDYSESLDVLNKYVKTHQTLIACRMFIYADDVSFYDGSTDRTFFSILSSMDDTGINCWIEKWPQDEKYLT